MAFRISDGNAIEQIIELAAGYAIGGATSTALEPLLQALRNRLWALDPNAPADPQILALLLRLGAIDPGAAAGEAAHSGISATNLHRYRDALYAPPSPAELLELQRRGHLDVPGFADALGQAGLDPRYHDAYRGLLRNLPSVADLAMWRQQEFIGDSELQARAAEAGFDASDAELYFKAAGLPPGIETGLELLRRGLITEARFAEYVAEGHTKTKYTGDLLHLQHVPLSPAVAAELLIRERISQEEAVAIAAKGGLAEQDFLTWSRGLGRPIAPGEALTIINRGKKGPPGGAEARAYFHEVVARSDVRTQYADDLMELRIHYPPLFQIERALNAGTITKELAAATLEKEGYPKEWVQALVDAHAKGHTVKTRDLAASIVDTLYEAGLYSHPEAEKALEHLGYDEAEAGKYLELWLARRIVAELVRGIGVIRARYVGWKIDRPEAVHLLGSLTGDGGAADRLMPLWDDEREASAPVLTAAQIANALKYGRYTLDRALEAWQRLGYTAEDALTLAWIESKGDPHRPAAAH